MIDLLDGEVLQNLNEEDLMTAILNILQSIYIYNKAVSREGYIGVYDTFKPYMDAGYSGIFLENLSIEELESLLGDIYLIYTKAVYMLEKKPELPLMLDSYGSIIQIQHTA